jgi:flagellar hook-associated protein FlgK
MALKHEAKVKRLEEIKQFKDIVYNGYYPGISKDKKQSSTIEQMADSWKELFGDPEDPQVKQEIDKTVEGLLSKCQNLAQNP